MDPPDLCVVGVGGGRRAQLDLGLSQSGRVGKRGEIRHRIVGRVETVRINMSKVVNRRFCTVVDFAVGDPQWRVIAG